ncbi:hypothetical protein D3C81_1049200 [compost metagenome]
MRQVGAAVHEFVGARQRRGQLLHFQHEAAFDVAGVELLGQGVQARGQVGPVLQRQLQGGGNAAGPHGAGEIARNHDKGAVAAAFLQGTKLHGNVQSAEETSFNCNEYAGHHQLPEGMLNGRFCTDPDNPLD